MSIPVVVRNYNIIDEFLFSANRGDTLFSNYFENNQSLSLNIRFKLKFLTEVTNEELQIDHDNMQYCRLWWCKFTERNFLLKFQGKGAFQILIMNALTFVKRLAQWNILKFFANCLLNCMHD